MNEKAGRLLDRVPRDCIGLPCCEVIHAREESGLPFCSSRCPVFCSAKRREPIEPVAFEVDARGRQLRVEVLVITLRAPDGTWPWLVHCVMESSRPSQVERYLSRVAHRNRDDGGLHDCARLKLTKREREVLELLGRDHDLRVIASELHLSHVTVRNHVQRILAKLGVHSMQEAVALLILGQVET